MHNEQLHRDLGKVEGRLETLTKQVAGLDTKLDTALEYIHTQKGARKATIAIASGVASLVGFVAGIAGTWFGK